jgi:type IV pilus assembly protein PilV
MLIGFDIYFKSDDMNQQPISQKKWIKTSRPSLPVKLQSGIALLEALIAILIFSFGVLGIIGLQSAMIKGTSQAKYRADASYIAQRRISMMWANPTNLNAATYNETNTAVPELPAGQRTTVVTMVGRDADVAVTVTWTAPGEDTHQYSANASISVCNNSTTTCN